MMMMNVEVQFVPVPSIVPVIVTAVALFLTINGPHNWHAFWHELTNPPADARHAIRKPSPYANMQFSQAELVMRRAQLLSFVQVYGIPLDWQQHQQQQQQQQQLINNRCGWGDKGCCATFCDILQPSTECAHDTSDRRGDKWQTTKNTLGITLI